MASGTQLEHLEELMYHSDKRAMFDPCVHLYILTDTGLVDGEMSLIMTDLAHTCLANYFSPHGYVCVSWIQREIMRRGLLSQEILNHTGCMVDAIDRALRVSQQTDNVAAILFLSTDAQLFMNAHETSFLDTLAVCLRTKRNEILKLSMGTKPRHL